MANDTSDTMETQDLLGLLPTAKGYDRTDKAHPAVTLPPQEHSFLRPPLRVVHRPAGKPGPFVIVSAPGAVGKTALAHYVAAQKNMHLWDLSRLKLGDNSFVGTVAKCFGAANLPAMLTWLKDSDTGFVLDAFDEAEILSGWERVEQFVDELADCTQGAPRPAIVLLARSETAFLLFMHLQERRGIECLFLEIDYFREDQAPQFVSMQVGRIARETGQPELLERFKKYKEPFFEAVNVVFRSIYGSFGVSESDAWNSSLVRSFLGYAPVLQAIAAYVSSFSNYQDVEKRVAEGALGGTGFSIASQIMKDLLVREQAKVVEALRAKGLTGGDGWEGWASLYAPGEQLERILLRAVKDNAGYSSSLAEVPGWLAEHYQEALRSFLPQHPFVRELTFAGPAFRDYTFAGLLRSPKEALRQKTRELMQQPEYVATPLLIHFFRDGNELVWGEDVGFLYESFSARDSVGGLPSAAMVFPPPHEQTDLHRLELYDQAAEVGVDPILLFVRGEGDNPANPANIIFSRRLRNATLAIRGALSLGGASNDFEVSDSDVSCSVLKIHSRNITVQSTTDAQEVRLQAGEYQQVPPTIQLQKRGPGALSVFWPGARVHPWAEYFSDAKRPAETGTQSQEVFLALRRILSWFRRDRREDLARHCELVKNVAVGSNPMRQLMFQYLEQRGILFFEEPLYKLEIKALERSAIVWADLRRGRASEGIQRFVSEFLAWKATGN